MSENRTPHPEWLPDGQKDIGEVLEDLYKQYKQGELLSITVHAEGVDGKIRVSGTELENSLMVVGGLHTSAAAIMHDELYGDEEFDDDDNAEEV